MEGEQFFCGLVCGCFLVWMFSEIKKEEDYNKAKDLLFNSILDRLNDVYSLLNSWKDERDG